MATNYKNTKYYTQTTKDTVPVSTAGTGTITTTAANPTNVVGSGTAFLTELKANAWIFITGQSEVRKVVRVEDDTNCIIDYGFTTPLAASAFAYVPHDNIRKIDIENVGAGSGNLDGAAFKAAQKQEFWKPSTQSASYDMLEPIVADAAGTTFAITIIR